MSAPRRINTSEPEPFEDEKDEEQLEREIDFKDAQAEFLRAGDPWN